MAQSLQKMIENKRDKHLVWWPIFIGRGAGRGKRAKKRPRPPQWDCEEDGLSVGDALRHQVAEGEADGRSRRRSLLPTPRRPKRYHRGQEFRRRGRGGGAKGDKGLPQEWPSVAAVGVAFSRLTGPR